MKHSLQMWAAVMVASSALGAIAAGTIALLPSTASAGLLVADAKSCVPQPTSKPFARWGDQRNYMLAPGGSFELGAPQIFSLVGMQVKERLDEPSRRPLQNL